MVTKDVLHRVFQVGIGLLVASGLLYLSFTHGTGRLQGQIQAGNAVVRLDNYDGDGQALESIYPKPPKRVLVTYPGATEVLIEMGLGSSIVGTIKPYGPEPPSIKATYDALPLLAAPFVPAREEVVQLHPDLIMAWSHHFQPNALGVVQQWQVQGVSTYVVPATVRRGQPTIENTVYPFIDDVGALFGVEERARMLRQSLEARVNRVVENADKIAYRPTVLVLQTYGNSTYSVYGSGYIIHDVVDKAGGRNITQHQLNSVGPERILGFDPDYIVLVVANSENESELSEAVGSLQADPNLGSMRAIQEGHIIPIEFSQVNNGNQRVIDALELIHQGLR